MNLIDKAQVAEILGVSEARIDRMTKEKLLNSIVSDDGKVQYDKAAIEQYKSFAERMGGL